MPPKKNKILLVDDDPNACYILSTILKLNDFDVVPFTDPELALAGFGKDQYDLLLLDVNMPQMSGFELYKKMKEIDRQAKVCFITNSRPECLQQFRESFPKLAPNCLAEKPASGSDLLAVLKAHLS